MKVSSFFSKEVVLCDAEVSLTQYSNSIYSQTVTFAETEHYLIKSLENDNVSAVITTPELAKNIEINKGLVSSSQPKKDFFALHNYMFDVGVFNINKKSDISSKALISPTAIIKDNVIIEDNVVIEDYVVIESNSILREGVFVGAHAVVGARGMHNTMIDGECIWVQDAGGVTLEEGVQVLAHATVQKSYFSEQTRIGRNSVVSVQCNIGHGCQVGDNTLIAGNAQLAGYVTVGNNVWIGPSVTIAHNVKIGDSAEVLLGSVVINDIVTQQKVSGNFAMKHTKNIRKFTKESR